MVVMIIMFEAQGQLIWISIKRKFGRIKVF